MSALALESIYARRTRAIVFDFDGTLVDTMQSFADTAASVMAERYSVHYAWARRRYLETSGNPFAQQLDAIFPGDARNAEAADEFEQRKLSSFFEETFDQDVADAIEGLRSEGYAVVISSNNFQHLLDQFVAREGVVFDAVLGCRENFFKGQQHFHHIEETLGVHRDEIVFVGDSLLDGVKARECGVRFVAKTGTFSADAFRRAHPGVATVERIAELAQLVPVL